MNKRFYLSLTAPANDDVALSPAARNLILSPTAPSISFPGNISLSPARANLILSPTAPSIPGGVDPFPAAVSRINMLASADSYSTSSWTKTNSSVGSTTTAPDGTSTAQKIVEAASLQVHNVQQQVNRSATVAMPFRAAYFVKAGERTRCQCVVNESSATSQAQALVNLSDGTIVSAGASGSFTYIGSAISSFGSGWYRVTIDFTSDATANLIPAVFLDNSSGSGAGSYFYTGDGTSGLYLWKINLLPKGAWDFASRTFFDDFLSSSTIDTTNSKAAGFNWYVNNAWPAIGGPVWGSAPSTQSGDFSVASSILTITNTRTAVAEALNTAVSSGPTGHIGTTFAPPFLIEGSISIDPANATGSFAPGRWPVFWTIAIEALDTAPGVLCDEFDFVEFIPSGSGTVSPGSNGANTHQWNPHYERDGSAVIGSPTYTTLHTYSTLLLTSAVNGGTYSLRMNFFDGVASMDMAFSPGTNSIPSTGGAPNGVFSNMDNEHYPIMLGSGTTANPFPINIDYISVYQ